MRNKKQFIPPPYTEGHWDETDVKINIPIYKKIDKWSKKYAKSTSNLGKWYCQLQLNKLRKKLS